MKFNLSDKKKAPSLALVAFVLILLIGTAYANSVKTPFYFDDYLFLADNHEMNRLSNLRYVFNKQRYFEIAGEHTYRPVPFVTYLILNQVFTNSPIYWRLFNLTLHFTSCFLFYLVLRRFGLAHWLALLCASLFAVHTVNTVLINMITTNSEMMGGLLCLLSFYWYFKEGRFWRFGSIVVYLLAYFAKETYVVLPALCLVFSWWELRERFRWRAFIIQQLPYLLVACLCLYVSLVLMKHPLRGPVNYPGGSLASALMTFAVALLYYLKIFFVPLGLTPIYEFPVFTSLLDWQVSASLFFLLIVLAVIVLGFKKQRAYAPFLSWFFIFLLPTSNIVPSGWIVNEWYLFLPLMGLIAGLLLLGHDLLEALQLNPQKPVLVSGILFFIFLSYLTVQRNRVWQDPQKLWTGVLKKNPDNMKALTCLGNYLLEKQKYQEALEVYLQAVKKHPRYAANYLNAACAYDMLNQKEKAVRFYSASILLDEREPRAYSNLGSLLLRNGEYAKAKIILLKGLKITPENPTLNEYLRLVKSKLGGT